MIVRRGLIAILAGLIVALGVFLAVDARDHSQQMIDVVVAARDLPARTVLRNDMLRTVAMPRSVVPPGALFALGDADARVLRDAEYSGGIIREQNLASAGATISSSLLIPAGKQYAFNLPVSLFLSAPPRLEVHDRIDIVGYPRGQTIDKGGVLVENLEVIDLSPHFTDNVSDSAFLTIGATADDILRILAVREGYNLGIALRPYVHAGSQ